MALAPEQAGIGIRRHFTTEGIHPYDEITWERRDARITNFRDGSVAFEQLDVEVPVGWSLNATNILAQKYFRGTLGTAERETSLRQVADRVVDTITGWGRRGGYFVDEREAEAFSDDLKHLVVTQKAAFNSPVWFNIGVAGVPNQGSACFILAVDDTMDSILNWYVEEGTIFKGGSGSGINLSNIRSSVELLKGGGTASGPVSFMRGADASAGTIKSGGKTRRAAKMVILNVDHPDVEEFIWCKAREERKARVLRDAGFDMDLDGLDSHSTQYQNANNSVRVTDEFMQAVLDDADWHLRAVTTGDIVRTVRARDLMRQISTATWECADPGMQFDTTINRWHTAATTGRINGSNPCFTGDTWVHTDRGLVQFVDLIDRVRLGESFGVYTHDATSPNDPAEQVQITTPGAVMITGFNEIVKLGFTNGMELRCTANHGIFTRNRGYVRADELTANDDVAILDLPTPAVAADWRLPISSDVRDYTTKGDWSASVRLPEKWTPQFAHYLGWLVGVGGIAGDAVTTAYGSDDDKAIILPEHRRFIGWMNGDREPKPSVQPNGTVQLRQTRPVIARFLEALGVSHAKAADKTVPWSVNEAPPDVLAAFLRGLFDADGCVYDGPKSRYVGLGSASAELLKGVQRLLSTFGITSRIHRTKGHGASGFCYTRKDGINASYDCVGQFDLRISSRFLASFASLIGFAVPAQAAKLEHLLRSHRFYQTRLPVRLATRVDDGVELTYNLSEPANHSYIANSIVVRNCSEYMHLDNSACNLASLNLLRFVGEDDDFDVEGFKAAVEVVFTAQEILVGNADYPTERIAETTRRFRQLGLGFANLGALLMALGLAYDSDGGRAWAGAVTALMTGHAYATSARIAARMGPFAGYADNREHTLRVLNMHREAAAGIDEELVPADLLGAAQQSWDVAYELAADVGVRNSQATVLAPTGCLVGGSLVATARGLVRLGSLGDPDGAPWQDLDEDVQTDEGPRRATRFFVNGPAPVVDVCTSRGYQVRGTPTHRVRIVDDQGRWVWRRFADLRPGDTVPMALDQLVGDPRVVDLLPMSEAYRAGEHHVSVPRTMTPDLAELVGYFMGDGSLPSPGLRLCVAADDFDVVEHLERLAKSLFGVQAAVVPKRGYVEVALHSVRLASWWEACGFARHRPHAGHRGKGYSPHLPDAVLHSNDREVYGAFLRGLFEADGTVGLGYPSWTTTSAAFSHDVQTLLLALGYPTTRRAGVSGRGSWRAVLRLSDLASSARFVEEIGFLSGAKIGRALDACRERAERPQAARHNHIPVGRELIDRVVPTNGRNRRVALMQHRRTGSITRRLATEVYGATGDAELGHLLRFFYDRVQSAELGTEELTYDLSVPDNVTYVANGFVSHNTIGLLMDCDTTGVEPDLGLVKMKKLVGGGTMSIVNQTIPRALRRLGYSPAQIDEIIAYVDEHKSILGAPHLVPEHVSVFACSMGDNTIHYSGHVRMMGAVQPFISGAISKCVTGETLVPTADGLVRIGSLHEGEAPDTFRHEVLELGSLGGSHKTDAFYYGGVRPAFEVVLRSGHRVTATPNHRLLVAGHSGLEWKRIDEIDRGDFVAAQYGGELWSSAPAGFDGFVPSRRHGAQKAARLPTEMSEQLAFLLGALAAQGHITRANHAVHVTNSVPDVRRRVLDAWHDLFGLGARVVDDGSRCPSVVVTSKTVVELLDHLACGARASEKRIPDAVLRSPREMVLAYLQGLALEADATVTHLPNWRICLDSAGLLDDLQSVLTNLGVVQGRCTKWNARYAKSYDEVFVVGEHAQRLVEMVPFLEPDKAARAAELSSRVFLGNRTTADVVPGILPYELYDLLPKGRSGRSGHGWRSEFAYLCDARTSRVTRRSLERVAAVPGVVLPPWLRQVLDDDLHLSPVESVTFVGDREVFDLSVPATQAFVGNGIVNHNTVNMPEEASVEDVEQLHIDAWRLGIKAVAIYRDNCKVAQPLSTVKKELAAVLPAGAAEAAQIVERAMEAVVREPVRRKLPRNRRSRTFEFRVADCKGFVTVGEYPDGRPGEIFIRISKQGSTLAGIMDAFAISVSYGLQYGVPLRAYIETLSNTRFEPAGITDDPEIRFASSVLDYIFRRLAVDYLSPPERAELGILTVGERTQPTLPGVEETAIETVQGHDVVADPPSIESASTLFDEGVPRPAPAAAPAAKLTSVDAPYCMQCGVQMQRAGSCHACPSCGTTSGCS